MHKNKGFTLLEILIALFIFSMVALMLTSALHNIINVQSGTEKAAEKLRSLQIATLLMSRDVEQIVNRPIINTSGRPELAFEGTSRGFTFTHAGLANPTGAITRSTLQRAKYYWDKGSLYRATWVPLDQAPESKPSARNLLTHVTDVRFEYLDSKNRFREAWPVSGQSKEPLPRAVRLTLTISDWGKFSQLYVIPAKPSSAIQPQPKS